MMMMISTDDFDDDDDDARARCSSRRSLGASLSPLLRERYVGAAEDFDDDDDDFDDDDDDTHTHRDVKKEGNQKRAKQKECKKGVKSERDTTRGKEKRRKKKTQKLGLLLLLLLLFVGAPKSLKNFQKTKKL